MEKGITVHLMVKNEENFIQSAIESVLPIAKQIIVFDTGSTDRTVEIVEGFDSKKVKLVVRGSQNPGNLIKLRNEMIEMTKTEWFFVVDGDEIFIFKSPQSVLEKLEKLPENICRAEVTIRDFVNDAHLVARDRISGKFWRSEKIIFSGEYPFEYPTLKNNPKANFESYSSNALKNDVLCYHMQFFARSSKDSEVRVGRHWRKSPFPVLFYFGPYPKNFPIKNNVLFSVLKFVFYNLIGVSHLLFHKKEQQKDATSRN